MQTKRKGESKCILVGERYLVTWKNGQLHDGDVIDSRPIKQIRDAGNTDIESLSTEELEFYVHYPGYDRRLDEWITLDRINIRNEETFSGDDSKNNKFRRKSIDLLAEVNKKDEKEIALQALEKEHEEITKVKNIQCIVLGRYEIETWYFSPYPEEYSGDDKMYVCEYCLKYMKRHKTLIGHSLKCSMRSPPGREIYREGGLSMFEIDGRDYKIYCQNLCLLSKLFLDHKTLYYDVDPFLFYVLCEVEEPATGAGGGEETLHHIVGYFSKEKQSQENYNLACILTFPPYQRKGYGKFLMSVSYEITKREGTTGSPEKPLSDLGKISYRSYWTYVILTLFQDRTLFDGAGGDGGGVSTTMQDLSRLTGFKTEDILSTLHSLNLIKYWKGQHVISINKAAIEAHLSQTRKIRLCDPRYLTWQPPGAEKGSSTGKINKL